MGDSNSRDAAYWAEPVSRLEASRLPEGVAAYNVEGRQVAGPLQGFGQMWQKTYRVRLSGAQVAPAEVVRVWRENFGSFWPEGNRFYGSATGIAPGEVAVLNLSGPEGVGRISTGVMVIYVDEESFSFMTPEGHPLAGIITFSAYEHEAATVVQVQCILRASDPIYELGMRLGVGHRSEDRFWRHTIRAVAAHFGVTGHVQEQVACLDPRVQWSEAKNIWKNAGVRTTLYLAASPLRWARDLFKRGGRRRGRAENNAE